MSSYGSATAVVVQPWTASQEFRNAVQATLPSCVTLPAGEPLTTAGVSRLLNQATAQGHLDASQARNAAHLVARAQRDEVTAAATATLTSLGFHVQTDRATTSTIWAERGHQVMAMEVHDGGGFEYDLAGLEGPECGTILQQFHAGMAGRGVGYAPIAQTHNDPRGGQLIRRVRRHRGPATGGRGAAGARVTT